LFIDSSKVSLKAVLLHNRNKLPPVPLSHATNIKEFYENMKLLLETIQYEKYNWNICGDLKVPTLQLGYTKFCCSLCDWDSRNKKHHYIHKQWTHRESLIPGQKSVVNTPLINHEKIYLCPVYIKLGLIKNVGIATDQNSAGYTYLKD
jgi:hypothetical protein